LFPEIGKIVRDSDVGAIVVGLPLEPSGAEGASAEKVRDFEVRLREYLPGVDIILVDERLTSSGVERMLVREFDMSRARRKGIVDKMAAREILQGALDAMNREE
jgi:putative Holliday junction resolvase